MDESELARGFSLNPLVQTHCAQLGSAGGLLVFHPDWWGGPPAQLKGWIDRVLRQGVGYDLEGADHVEKEWRPLLGGKKALVFVTTDSPDPGDASRLELFWSRQVLGKCGMICGCEVLMDMRGGRAGQRVEWMASLERRLAETFPAGA